jgi:hypothetical protein
VIVAGKFENAGGAPASRVARWDGSSWSPLGLGLNDIVNCLELLPNGDLIAAGIFTASGATSMPLVARWDGTSWSQLGAGLVGGEIRSMARMANGDVVVAGSLTGAGGSAVNGVARWDGTSWSGFPFQSLFVSSVAVAPNGDLFVSGPFTRLAGMPSAAFGRAITSCPALVQSYGSGCIGPSGPLVLASLSSPWSGSEYRTRLYGAPSSCFVVNAIGGTSVSVSLPSLLPQSFSGCSLLVSGDVLDLIVPSNGVAEPSIQIPSTPALVGAAFYQQVLAFQVDPSFNLLNVSSSNGLIATIGFF